MANRYANIPGASKINQSYNLITEGFDKVEQEMDAKPDASIAQVNDIAFDADDTLTVEGGTGITVTTIPGEKKMRIVATGEATPGAHAIEHITGGSDVIPNATTTSSGLMSASDKTRLDGAMLKTADSDLNMNNRSVTNISTIHFRGSQILTIDGSKSITINRTMHRVNTSGGADELHTINGGNENDLLILRIVTASNPVTIKHGVGNIQTPDDVDISLTNVRQWVLMVRTSVDWHVIASGVGLNRSGDTMTGNLAFSGTINRGIDFRGGDASTIADLVNFPELATENAAIRLFRNTNTSGTKIFQISRGDGTAFAVFQIMDGEITRINGLNVTITAYNGDPNGNVAAPPGSICLDTTNGKVYKKASGSGNTGWQELT